MCRWLTSAVRTCPSRVDSLAGLGLNVYDVRHGHKLNKVHLDAPAPLDDDGPGLAPLAAPRADTAA